MRKYNSARESNEQLAIVTPVQNPLYNESSWCVPPFETKREEKKKEARAKRKKGKKRHARERARAHARRIYYGRIVPLSFSFSEVFRSLVLSRARKKEHSRKGEKDKEKEEEGKSTSRARVLARTSATEKDPLLRPHYIVYLSEPPLFLALRLLLSSSSSPLSCLLALRLLVSRNKQLPFPSRIKRTYAHLPFFAKR